MKPDLKLGWPKPPLVFSWRLYWGGMKYRYGPMAVRAGPWFGSKCWYNRRRKPVRGI